MKNLRFWIPTIVGALITPVFITVAMISTGAGHGSYTSMLIFYPAPSLIFFLQSESNGTWLIRVLDNFLVAIAVGAAIVQFPLYGFLVSYSRLKRGVIFLGLSKWIALLHVVISTLWLPIALLTKQ